MKRIGGGGAHDDRSMVHLAKYTLVVERSKGHVDGRANGFAHVPVACIANIADDLDIQAAIAALDFLERLSDRVLSLELTPRERFIDDGNLRIRFVWAKVATAEEGDLHGAANRTSRPGNTGWGCHRELVH